MRPTITLCTISPMASICILNKTQIVHASHFGPGTCGPILLISLSLIPSFTFSNCTIVGPQALVTTVGPRVLVLPIPTVVISLPELHVLMFPIYLNLKSNTYSEVFLKPAC